jgi:hypothetical protein
MKRVLMLCLYISPEFYLGNYLANFVITGSASIYVRTSNQIRQMCDIHSAAAAGKRTSMGYITTTQIT